MKNLVQISVLVHELLNNNSHCVWSSYNSLKSYIFFNPMFIPGFSGSRFFRLQVSQDPGSGSRVRIQVLQVAGFFSNVIKALFHGFIPQQPSSRCNISIRERNTEVLRLKFYFQSFIVTGQGIGVYDSNVWSHLSVVSLRFQMCSSMVRLVSCISLSFYSCFYRVFSDAIHCFSVL